MFYQSLAGYLCVVNIYHDDLLTFDRGPTFQLSHLRFCPASPTRLSFALTAPDLT